MVVDAESHPASPAAAAASQRLSGSAITDQVIYLITEKYCPGADKTGSPLARYCCSPRVFICTLTVHVALYYESHAA